MSSAAKLILIGLVVSGLGCKGAKPDLLVEAPISALPSGWTMFTDQETGASIGIAPGWTEGTGLANDHPQMSGMDPSNGSSSDPNSAASQVADGLSSMIKNMDAESEAKERARLRSIGDIINVVDASKSTIGEARTRYYVKKIHHDSAWPLEYAIAEEHPNIKGAGDGVDVQLPVGKAHKFMAQNTTVGGDVVVKISYVLADGNDAYIIRFISTNSPEVFKTIESTVAQTFRLKHKA